MNPMKYYVDAAGVYLGGWDANPPDGAIEAPFPPDDARQKWNGEDWLPSEEVAIAPISDEELLRRAMLEDFIERSAKNATTPKALKEAALRLKDKK